MTDNLDAVLAQQYFEEAAAMFARDGGLLWGVSLDGPVIFVDNETRDAVANHPDNEGHLSPQAGLWIGRIPPEVVLANTARIWAGVHWVMIVWQALSKDPLWRAEFIAHEAFHRIQAEVGLPPSQTSNAHLDTLQGRYWLQLEWRALERALVLSAEARRSAIADALLFRAVRRTQFQNADAQERSLEMHEGLAEYTGFRFSGVNDSQTAEYLCNAPGRYPSFVRSFAYASGPAYGLLLDETRPTWREGLTPQSDLGILLQQALSIHLPTDPAAAADGRTEAYGGQTLHAQEVKRDRARQAEISQYRSRLLQDPALILPISPEVQCAFDPRATIPMPESGTVFAFIRVSDTWGLLDLEHGGLWMSDDWKSARITAPASPESRPLTADGWTLQLSPGWHIRPVEGTPNSVLAQDGDT